MLLGLLRLAAVSGGALAQAPRAAAPGAAAFGQFQAPDGTFRVELPADWQLAAATPENFQAFSPLGEAFRAGKLDVFLDAQSLEATLEALQITGQRSPQELMLMRRLVAPPLTPDGVVRTLFPQIGGAGMQRMRIGSVQDLGAQSQARGAIIHYQYTLLPQADPVLRSILPPALQNYGEVPMQAAAVLYTYPATVMGVVRYWSVAYEIAEAPQPVFAANRGAYRRIFQSYRIDPAAVRQRIAAVQRQQGAVAAGLAEQDALVRSFAQRSMQRQYEQLEQDRTWRSHVGDRYVEMAGGEITYRDPADPSWSETVHVEDVPWGQGYRAFRCTDRPGYDSEIRYSQYRTPPPHCRAIEQVR